MSQANQKTDSKFELLRKHIVSKCIHDTEFKKEFLANPKLAIEKAFNIKVPPEVRINAIEIEKEDLYIFVPSSKFLESNESKQMFELSDEELKAISGGVTHRGGGWLPASEEDARNDWEAFKYEFATGRPYWKNPNYTAGA